MKNKLTATDYQKKKTRERRKRDKEHKEHLKDLSKLGGYPTPTYPVDENHKYTNDEEKVAFYKRLWRGKRSKYYKKKSNEMVRRHKDEETYSGGLYRKLYEFWWSLW